ncbi:DNA cytosine methyltransferase [Pusillimonas sp. SM2304]|uniref:DNA cytosine methyltransferase n=1 Tax=Pusillimonas sp. SM2304 TaxID=3073241 RepID=UPI00287532D7|nr:DNA cytosine methyltransferase [Pusillimonas sp. SM2304]MDS1141757.1 DNA cytosine methyltransferase [Pusillimonas sp. SM2304]
MIDTRNIYHFGLFPGSGGGKKGFKRAQPRIPGMEGKFVYVGGMDIDAVAVRDCDKLGGYPTTVRDLSSREQFIAINGHEPPAGWMEVTPDDVRAAAHGHRPNVVFLSAPCKGFSGLLAKSHSASIKYQAMNGLTLRAVWLCLEAWKDDLPEFFIFENVPLIMTRGRKFLDQIIALFRHYGYIVRETVHDCGEIGGLAQSRRRFLLVARHAEKMPSAVYEPPVRPLRSVGEILDRMHLPGDPAAGPMHRVPRLAWKTWVRLAFVEAGKDWRSLNRLAVEDGCLRDYLIVPGSFHNGYMGVNGWDETVGTVRGRSLPLNGAFSIADPRAKVFSGGYGVNGWNESTGAVAGESLPSNGRFAVADPRAYGENTHKNVYKVVPWDGSAGVVSGGHGPSSGGQCVADPRHLGAAKHNNEFRIVPYTDAANAVTSAHGTGQCVADPRGGHGFAKYGVTAYSATANAVISGSTSGQGAYAVADPRPNIQRTKGDNYLTGGHYGVKHWNDSSMAVSASACHDNGWWSVADRRTGTYSASDVPENVPAMPAPNDKLVCRIQSMDGTWHRPFTTLELAAIQSYYDPDDFAEHGPLIMEGTSDQVWREHIGNMVPPAAALAMAEEIGRAILLSWAGETFQLSSTPIWVRPFAIAISVRGNE